MRAHAVIAAVGISAFLGAACARAQTNEASMKLRLAQSFERAGDWEQAIPIYESLLISDPKNFVYYDALRRGYVQLKEYDKAVELIGYRLTMDPGNPQLLSSLGSVYYQRGNERAADSIWQSIIQTNASNANLYRLIAGQMMEYRLYDRAISLFLQARQVTGDEGLFATELANLYGAFQQYENAANEYVRLLIQQPLQVADIQSRMSVFLTRPEALPAVRRVIQSAVLKRDDVVPLRQLYAWVLMEAREYAAALEQYRFIDRRSKTRGMEMFNFAQRSLDEKEWLTAARAFREVLDTPPPKELVPVARLGLARALEQLSAHTDTSGRPPALPEGWPVSEAPPSSALTLSLFEAIIREYPGSPHAGQALFRVGVIKRDRLNDLDGALTAFDRVSSLMTETPLALESSIAAAGVLLMKNDLAGARQRYRELLVTRNAAMRDRVLFQLAELDYFSAAFDSALVTLRQLVRNPSTDLANDALDLLYFIEENIAAGSAALKDFASADLLFRRGRTPEALEQFRAVLRSYPDAYLADDAVLRVAELHLRLGSPREAIATLRTMAIEMPGSILRDRAQMRIGEIHERILGNTMAAVEAYEELLKLFPTSLHAEEARRRIRLLRGDIL
jgi:tetratricopeptide (TPR) repeat protein